MHSSNIQRHTFINPNDITLQEFKRRNTIKSISDNFDTRAR